MNATTRRRGVVPLLLGAAAAIAVVVTMMIPGLTPFSPDPAAAADSACTVSYYALDPNDANLSNPGKEVTGAFGPAVAARDEAGVKAELDERRECGADMKFDPALTAAHYSEWSHNGLTSIKVDESPDGLNAFTAQLANDKDLRGKVLTELKKLEGESTFSTAPVSAGIWSLYMMPNGSGGVSLKVGQTSADGTNAVFTHGDKVIRYRLDCGFQPNRDTPFTNVPECTGGECAPPPVCPPGTTGDWPNCVTPPPPCNPEWQKCWETSVTAPEGVNPQGPGDYETPDSVTAPDKPAPVINGDETQTSTTPATDTTPVDPDRNKPDPATGTDSNGNTGTVNPDTGGPNNTDTGNPFG